MEVGLNQLEPYLDQVTNLKDDQRRVVKLQERKAFGRPHALDSNWHFQGKVE